MYLSRRKVGFKLVWSVLFILCLSQFSGAQELDPTRVESFFDEAWNDTLRADGKVPGAIVTVVHQGEVILNKGYGVSDIETQAPVSPDNTRIRIGSVSKLFTALTALAFVDEGRVDLDRDVNDYLSSVQVPNTYEDPVTLRMLLSHKAGFEEGISGFMVFDNNGIGTDQSVYQRHLVRVHPPNSEYAYDNLGLGLTGTLLAEVNHSTFADAVDEKIFVPLGLTNTTVGVPDFQLKKLAACHTWDKQGNIVKCRPKFMKTGSQGAGAITTTGTDMAKFMLALLNEGCANKSCIVKADTFKQFSNLNNNRLHPLGQGMGFIIVEKQAANRLAMGHDGGQDGFTTSLILFPETGTGLFISSFLYEGIPLEWNLSSIFDFVVRQRYTPRFGQHQIEQKFAFNFLPPRNSKPLSVLLGSSISSNLDFLAGTYVDTPTHSSSAMLINRLADVANTIKVVVDGDKVYVNDEGPFRHTGSGVLESSAYKHRWLFTETEQGVILQHSNNPVFVSYIKKPWYWDAAFTVLPLLIPLLMIIPALLFSFTQRREKQHRTFGLLVVFSAAATWLGLFLELEYFPSNYFPDGTTLALVSWRSLLSLGWAAALAVLIMSMIKSRQILGFTNLKTISRSILAMLFILSSIVVAVLLPYWGMVGNFYGA